MPNKEKKVLVVDDHAELVDLISSVLKSRGIKPIGAFRGTEALEQARLERPDLAVVDLLLPDLVGYNLVDTLLKEHGIRSIIMTGVFKGLNFAEEAKSRHAVVGYFEKPFQLEDLARSVEAQLRGNDPSTPAPEPSFESASGTLAAALQESLGETGAAQTEQSKQWDLSPEPMGPMGETTKPQRRKIGRLGPATFPRLLNAFYLAKQTGELTVSAGSASKVIFFAEGLPVFATSNQPTDMLGHILVRHGVISEPKRGEIVQSLSDPGSDEELGNRLVRMGVLAPDDLLLHVRAQVRQILYSLMLVESGTYSIDFADQAKEHPIHLDGFPANLILSAVRGLYDLVRLQRLVSPERKFLPSPNPTYELHQIRLTDREAMLLTKVDGNRSVQELVELGITDEVETYALVYGLAIIGVLAALK